MAVGEFAREARSVALADQPFQAYSVAESHVAAGAYVPRYAGAMLVAGVIAIVVGLGVLAVPLAWWRKLPKERPNKNWVPTAAQVVEHRNGHAVVSYAPPGRDGLAQMTAVPPASAHEVVDDSRVLVLLDPLNPVQPFLLDVWTKREALRQRVTLICALAAAVLVTVGAVLIVLGLPQAAPA